ncbi:MAG TPA: ATP-binding protein [Ignavibacteria bacterium]|nr:ATP-binding protein [Ignavibacteria bacterium]
MEILKRQLQQTIESNLIPNKVIVLQGARRVGKTVLIRQIINNYGGKALYLNAEDSLTTELLKVRSIASYRRNFSGIQLLVIDEAQTIPEIGKILKLIVDEIKGIRIIATGSSAFDLLNRFGEPLTGRSITYHLFPFSQSELMQRQTVIEAKQEIENRLLYGSYPELFHYETIEEKRVYLYNLVHTYLLKDILTLDGIRGASRLMDLLKLIALQIGNEVSSNELSKKLGMSKNTVDKYLDLLSKVFIIFPLRGFSKNLRKEISKSVKWYFYDTGVRNAIISNFNELILRQDAGSLWENYLISERLKKHHYEMDFANLYFWRTYDQQEIDLVEEINGQLTAYEIKWGNKKAKKPVAWQKAYPDAEFKIINKDDFPHWIC